MTGCKIGVGIHDVTGPAAESGMMGYSMPEQKTHGIHTRLWSRAFIIEKDGKRVVYVTAEGGALPQGVSLEVLAKLKERFGDLYTRENVVLSASHTHSGPGGYSHYAMYNLAAFGYDEQNFNALSEGIFQSIVKAHNNDNLTPGKIKIIEGRLEKTAKKEDDIGFNRSRQAYEKNPAEEREGQDDINRVMTLLRFEDEQGKELAMLNWLAVHPTSIGKRNKLISSDNKGYAAYMFEKEKGTDYLSGNSFVGAFATSDCGDVSPNIWGNPADYEDPIEEKYLQYMKIMGSRQLNHAKKLYEQAETLLEGDIDYRHRYVDMSNVTIDPIWIADKDKQENPGGTFKTCPGAIGLCKVAGSWEDGIGLSFVHEGKIFGVNWPKFTLSPKMQACHKEKPILLPTGKMGPPPWTPQIMPLQIIKIGQLGLIVTPFECTTMTGRRLRKAVKEQLPELEYLVIAGYANAYSGYVATREEYSAQHYEGASTHFGPFTENAYRQEFHKLAKAMKEGQPVTSDIEPPDLKKKQKIKYLGVWFDTHPWFKRYGAMKGTMQTSYNTGETVKVKFWGAHPRNDLKIQDTYLKVEKKENGDWKTVARDWDPESIFRWKRRWIANSLITTEWTIPEDTPAGTYRIRHFGKYKRLFGKRKDYEGRSLEFEVKKE
jgi:neutral ceramidase